MFILFLLSFLFGVGRFEVLWITAGKSQTITFATSLVDDGLTISWMLKTSQTANLTLFRCTTTTVKMCDPFDDAFSELYTVNNTSNSTSLISAFTITYVTPFHHNSTWYCVANRRSGQQSAKYTFNVFALAESPTCANASLLIESEIQIHCSTTKVFSESVCVFHKETNNTASNEVKNGKIQYTHYQNHATGYYETNCTYTVSAAILGPGSHMFYVVMYPNITTSITEGMKTTSRAIAPISIYFPKAALSHDCKINSYIEERSTGFCTCYNNYTSFLPTQVIWTHEGSIICSDKQLEFLASRPSTNQQSFMCTVSNDLGWADQVNYQPNVAFGPDSNNLLINNSDMFMCENEKAVHIIGTCAVSENNPPPSVYIIVNNSWIQLSPGTVKNEYRFNVSVHLTGIFNVTCYANNSIFGDIAAQMNQYVNIKGSSNVPHMFSITNSIKMIPSGNELSVSEGMTIVFCESQGNPLNTNLSFSCGNIKRFVANIGSAYIILNVSKETENINCSCDVRTELSCPKNTRSVILKIAKYQSDAVKETNAVAIGLGVTTGLAVIILLASGIVFIFWRRKQKCVQDSRAINKIEDYSKFEEKVTYLNKESDQYENPDLQKRDFATSSGNILVHPMQNQHSSVNTLGGFISMDKANEGTPKKSDHIYEEVTEKIELAIVQQNDSYLNVKINEDTAKEINLVCTCHN